MSKYPKVFHPAPLPAPRPPTFAADAIAAESLRRLVHRTWSGDLSATCAALQAHLAQHDTRRARLATVLLAGALDDTSRRLALRLVAQWFPAVVDDCITK